MITTNKNFDEILSIKDLLKTKILVIDGAMGTMIQRHSLSESDYRGEAFKNWHKDVKGNNDILSITQPELIKNIHTEYLESGADIIETNTFSSQRTSLEDFDMQEFAYQLNFESVQIAKQACDEYKNKTGKKTFIAGAIGPTNKTLSISPDINSPWYRSVTFDEISDNYYEQVKGLYYGGVDLFLIETVFDTLNCKAAIFAIKKFFRHIKRNELPIMISVTISDNSARTLSGQTLDAFYISIAHAEPLSVGLNCALGGNQMKPYVQQLRKISNYYVSCYPNAGLPNAMGEYDENPDDTAGYLREMLDEKIVNIVGGCCGTTPEHIKRISEMVATYNSSS